jgi:hypothetical protein
MKHSFRTGVRRIPFAIAVIIPAICAAQAAVAQVEDPFIAAIRSMKHSVTAVMCQKPDPDHPDQSRRIIVGTIFFVSVRGDFITADHTLQDTEPGHRLAGCEPNIWFSRPSKTPGMFTATTFPFLVKDCIRDSGGDMARCHTVADLSTAADGQFAPQPVVIDPRQRDDGTAIAITGYPLGIPVPLSSRGYIGAYQLDARGPVDIAIDHTAWPGISGSPVYDSSGKVVGMLVQAGTEAASGISIARSGFALSQFMAAHPLNGK